MAIQNEVRLTGNLGKDAEYRSEVGTGLATFSLAYNRYRPTDEGFTKSPPMWFRCVAWGKLAQKVSGLKKGERVSLVGRLESREWQDTQGVKHQTIEIVVESIVRAETLKTPTVDLSDANMPLNRTPAPATTQTKGKKPSATPGKAGNGKGKPAQA